MANQNIKVTEQHMSAYLDVVLERKNNRSPAETSAEIGEIAEGAVVAGAIGMAAGYFTLKSTIPETVSKFIASSYLSGKHEAIRENDKQEKAASNKGIAEGYYSTGPSSTSEFRDPVHVRKFEIAEEITPKVGNALVAIETLGPAIGWYIYQHNAERAEVLGFSMQQPDMHELASKWMEAEKFKSHADAILMIAERDDDGLRQRAVDESAPYKKINALLGSAGISQTIATTESSSVPHVQVDAYKKAVDQAFYRQVQASPGFAEPLVNLWLEYRELNYALDDSKLPAIQDKINLIAEHIERTGLAGYKLSVIQGVAKSAMQDLSQSATQELSSR